MSNKSPNIILIVCDQLRADCLGVSGNPVIRTPTFDSIARNGHYFSHARSEMPSCIGARRCIESGQAPEDHKMVGYQDMVPWQEENTLAKILGKNGYYTMNVGKRHNFPRVGEEGLGGYEYNKQYEEWREFDDGFDDDYHQFLKDNDQWYYGPFATRASNNSHLGAIFPLEERFHPSSWIAAEGCKAVENWDQNHSDKPFFMHLSFSAPHPPFTPPVNYINDYLNKDLPEPFIGDPANNVSGGGFGNRFFSEGSFKKLAPEELHYTRAAYYGLVSHIDACIHQVLFYTHREYRIKGVLENTIVVLTTDHGEMLGDHHRFNKTVGYEGSVRIPMMFNFPKGGDYEHLGRDLKYDSMVGNQDILPSILGAIGVDAPEMVTGKNLFELMSNKNSFKEREFFQGEHYGVMHYLVKGDYKFIWNYKDGLNELFNLKEDPYECENLFNIKAYEDVGKDLLQLLTDQLKKRGDTFIKDGKLNKPTKSLVELL
ncbi:MAG: hypothetical protein COA79_24250 [Planctomycetota bacterium]|nr:MAG: hypothetical protein COA79_24250 [Planctomycetota bacterium]